MRVPLSRFLLNLAMILIALMLATLASVLTDPGKPSPTSDGSMTVLGATATPQVTPVAPISYVVGTVTAGPVCPIDRSPEPSQCAPRPVSGAVIVATFGAGQEVILTATSLADGSYRFAVHAAGTYTLTPQPVRGLPGSPQPVTIALAQTETRRVDFQYDTGIR